MSSEICGVLWEWGQKSCSSIGDATGGMDLGDKKESGDLPSDSAKFYLIDFITSQGPCQWESIIRPLLTC